ncbi:ankyrin repeat-containing domain protein [Phaeosphaeriaceae sp. PMI808]|nr:ankyrin repeat-containing domain protein [Phaeosphaeriaceae sp. PMI808]
METYQPSKPTATAPVSKVFHSQLAQDQSRQHVGDVISQSIIFLTGNDSDKFPPDRIVDFLLSLVTKDSPHIKESLESLSFKDRDSGRRAITPECNGTCEWLLRHPRYKEWRKGGSGLLFIKGMLGSGKSTLMKYALKSEKKAEDGKAFVASFFFSGRGAALQRNAVGLFRSLLYQLLPQIPELFVEFRPIFLEKKGTRDDADDGWKWNKDELQQFFKNHIASKGHRIRILIDALDECQDEDIGLIVQYFHDLVKTTESTLSICFSCRRIPDSAPSDGVQVIRLEDENQHQDDILTYIKKSLQSNFPPRQKEAEKLEQEISTKASGIFRLAELAVSKTIAWKKAGKSKLYMLNKLREAPSGLDDIYHETLKRIADEDRPEALQLLQWICLATRPLSLTELRFAMASDWPDPLQRPQRFHHEVDGSEVYEDEDQINNLLRHYFPDLVEVIHEGDDHTVQLVHQSCHEYLMREGLQILHGSQGDSVLAESHDYLARTCVNYVTLEDVLQLAQSDQSKMPPFLSYASTSWVWHAEMAEARKILQKSLLRRLEWPSREIFQRWIDSYHKIDPWSDGCPDKQASLLHIAAGHGLLSVVTSIVQMDGACLETKDGVGRSALSYAAQRGHNEVVKELLQRGAMASSEDSKGRTALWYAIRNGHEAVVGLLLEKDYGTDTRESNIKSSLWYAARHGHEEVVLLLLKNGVDPDLLDGGGRTLLWHAAADGRTGLVRLLLEKGATPNQKDRHGRTPLLLAAINGHDRVVDVLLGKVGDADTKDSDGRTPLSRAAGNGHVAVVNSLLNKDAEVDSLDEEGRTPLWYGALYGHDQVVKLLLERGASATTVDNEGWSPLVWAAGYGHEAVVNRLLSIEDVDPGLRDKKGRTALSYAVENRHDVIATLLRTRYVRD